LLIGRDVFGKTWRICPEFIGEISTRSRVKGIQVEGAYNISEALLTEGKVDNHEIGLRLHRWLFLSR
jgi:hypothetical protein